MSCDGHTDKPIEADAEEIPDQKHLIWTGKLSYEIPAREVVIEQGRGVVEDGFFLQMELLWPEVKNDKDCEGVQNDAEVVGELKVGEKALWVTTHLGLILDYVQGADEGPQDSPDLLADDALVDESPLPLFLNVSFHVLINLVFIDKLGEVYTCKGDPS